MTAHPHTDQYLADMRDRLDPTLEERPAARDLADLMRRALPHIDPMVVGEVMLHAGVHLNQVADDDVSTVHGAAVLLTVVGRQLHTERLGDVNV